MIHLRLIKGASYTGVLKASRKEPDVYTEDEAMAEEAVASGYFCRLEDGEPGAATDSGNTKETVGYGGKTLEQMNKPELETFAAYRDVDIKGAKNKAEIIAKLKEALPAHELEGEISYGSPTMTELQKERRAGG